MCRESLAPNPKKKSDGSHILSNTRLIPVGRINPALLPLHDMRELLRWYQLNLCDAVILDPRGFRVRFLAANFVHLIKLTNKYGEEPRNARKALEEIGRGRIKFTAGRFDSQRASELSWVRLLASDPWRIVPNWQALGRGDEAYIRNFGTPENPIYRVLVCEITGTIRQVVTVFPRERISNSDIFEVIWP